MRFTLATLIAATAVLAAPSQTVKTGPSLVEREAPNHSVVIMDDRIFPSNTHAEVGRVIQFIVTKGSHSIVQSSYDAPCTPLEGGFSFGPIIVEEGTQNILYEVKDDKPIWFYNGEKNRCSKGLVAAINSPETAEMNVESFRKAAMQV